jgi:hypothetical protein
MMDVYRCLGIGIVMVLPSFVGAGAVWHIFNSWFAVAVWIILSIVVYVGILFKGQVTKI